MSRPADLMERSPAKAAPDFEAVTETTSAARPRRRPLWSALVALLAAALLLALTAESRAGDDHGRHFFGLWRTRHVLLATGLVWLAFACLAARSPRTLRRFAAVNVSGLLAWLAAEGLGLAGVVDYRRLIAVPDEDPHGRRAIPGLDVRGTTREDLALLWNLPSKPIEFHFKTDRRGFRNEPDRESADVYCLGDSYLVAGLVPFQETLAAQLEQRCARPVMNVALVGLAPQAECELLRDAHLPLAGRTVLHFIFEGNDLADSARWRQRGSEPPAPSSWKDRTLAHQLALRLQALTEPQPAIVARRTGWIGDTPYRFLWAANAFEGLEAELDAIDACLSAERREVEAAGGRYAVVLIPTTLRVLGPLCRFPPGSPLADHRAQCGPLPERLRAWSEREHVPLLDLTPALEAAARRGEIPWFPADTHWNALGHRVAAEAIAAWPVFRAWQS